MNNCILNQNFFDERMCSSFVLIKDKGILLNHIKIFNLPYQSKISVDSKFQYGVEIEFAKANLEYVQDDIRDSYEGIIPQFCEDWYTKTEETIEGCPIYGGEVVSPISHNTPDEWEKLDEICAILKDNKAIITDECSLHVHIDFDKLNFSKEQAKELLKLWATYEDVIYKFAMAEEVHLRDMIYDHARPLRNKIMSCNEEGDINNIFNDRLGYNRKLNAIKLLDLANRFNGDPCELPTIEFRVVNGSLNPKIIQNVIRFFCRLVNSVLEENKILDYYVEKRFDNLEYNYDSQLTDYEQANLEKALELSDIIYDNNMDKLCFLKQYLKEEEIEEAKLYQK